MSFLVNICRFCRAEDPDPVGTGDFWPAGSGPFFGSSQLRFCLENFAINFLPWTCANMNMQFSKFAFLVLTEKFNPRKFSTIAPGKK